MGVSFYTYGREGKLFIPIEKWTHLEGPGGVADTKVDALSVRVWVNMINKALLCDSEHGFDVAFPYLKPLMDLLDKPVDAATLKEFCSKTKVLSTDYGLIVTDHKGCHARLKKLIQQLLDDVKQADAKESRWRAFARLCRFYEGCVAIASPYWMQHGQMLWEYVAAYSGVAHRDWFGKSDDVDIHTYWWFDAVSWDVHLLDTKLCAQSVDNAKHFVGSLFQHVELAGSFGRDWDYFVSNNTLWLIRCLTRRPTISHLWGLYGDAVCARKFGRNLLFFNQSEPDEIRAMMEPVKRIGIINAFRNDAYVLELDSVSKNAEIVCEDIWKQFET